MSKLLIYYREFTKEGEVQAQDLEVLSHVNQNGDENVAVYEYKR